MEDKYSILYEMGDNPDMDQYFYEKGFRTDVSVKIGEDIFEVYFFEASTLQYEMTKDGYCSYPGLIILEEITTKKNRVAVEELFRQECFSYLKPTNANEKRFIDKIWVTPK